MSLDIATGGTESKTVTVAVQVAVFPLASVRSTVIEFGPISAHVSKVSDNSAVNEQLSENPPSIKLELIITCPLSVK